VIFAVDFLIERQPGNLFSMMRLGTRLLSVCIYCCLKCLSVSCYGQPACIISGGEDTICFGITTIWSAPERMDSYIWTGPSGFNSTSQLITIGIQGNYQLVVTDPNGTSSCSRNLTVYTDLLPGSINTAIREFCVGGTTAIGGTSSPYGPATGGSGSYTYTWQLQEGCTGSWTDINGTNATSYTPVAPLTTTCYRRKATDRICGAEAYTDFKRFEIYDDPVSQAVVMEPVSSAVCAGNPVSATFTGGSGGYPGGVTDLYEYSSNAGSSWTTYVPGQNISTTGLSGTGIVQIRTRRVSTGVNGCNYGSWVTSSITVNPIPLTTAIFHR
jgi:hypothetical protein